MPVRVRIMPRGEKREVEEASISVRALVEKLGLSMEGVVVVRDGQPLLESDRVRDGEEVTVILAASGG